MHGEGLDLPNAAVQCMYIRVTYAFVSQVGAPDQLVIRFHICRVRVGTILRSPGFSPNALLHLTPKSHLGYYFQLLYLSLHFVLFTHQLKLDISSRELVLP